jgi:dTDP-4-amino-4,6-dideoxygalactose transaminase
MPAPCFRYYGTPNSYRDILVAGLVGSLNRDERAVGALESQIEDFIGTGHALALPQARLGLYLALRRVLTPERPEVVLSPYTIYEVVNMVLCAGGTPVFADIEESTLNIDFDSAAGLIGVRTGAVLVTHLHGLACDIESFASLCVEKGIPLIEDCAQAFGATVKGRRVGSFGAMGVFSFSVKKHVNSLYGGCLLGNDAALMNECRSFLAELPPERKWKLLKRATSTLILQIAHSAPVFRGLTFPLLRSHVRRGPETALSAVRYEHAPIRRAEIPEDYLRRMTSCQAHLVSRQIPDVDRQIELRTAYAREYHSLLSDLPGIRLPPLREDGSHIYLSFAVQVPNRLEFQREMMAAGCDVRLQTYLNLASAPCYSDFRRDCPRAESAASRAVVLPICPGAGIEGIRRVAGAIRALMR